MLALLSTFMHLGQASAGESTGDPATVASVGALAPDEAPADPAEPVLEPQPTLGPVPDAQPVPEPAEPVLEPQPTLGPVPEAQPTAEPAEPVLEPQPTLGPVPDAQPTAEPAEPILEPQPTLEPVPDAQPVPEPAEPVLEPQPTLEPVPDAQPVPEPATTVPAAGLDVVPAAASGTQATTKSAVDPQAPSRSGGTVARAAQAPISPPPAAPAPTGTPTGPIRIAQQHGVVPSVPVGADVPADFERLLRFEQRAIAVSASVVAIAAPRMPTQMTVAIELGKAGSGWAGAVIFNVWLRRQLRERRMSQRQLAHMSGVDHSTISRLIGGGRTPTLETATRLARALRIPEEDIGRELGFTRERPPLPLQRVEAALRGDDELDEGDVRALMDAYLTRRRRHRLRAVGFDGASQRSSAEPRADPPP